MISRHQSSRVEDIFQQLLLVNLYCHTHGNSRKNQLSPSLE